MNMKINISGNFDLGDSFKEYVNDKCDKEINKFFDNLSYVDIAIKKDSNIIYSNITSNGVLSKGYKISANAKNEDIYSSFDEAFKKFITQLGKEKDKLISNKKQGK